MDINCSKTDEEVSYFQQKFQSQTNLKMSL